MLNMNIYNNNKKQYKTFCSLFLKFIFNVHFTCYQEMTQESTECEPEVMNSEDYLFMLYTSGSTGQPKGIAHTQAGYLLYAAVTHQVGKNDKMLFFYFLLICNKDIVLFYEFSGLCTSFN